MFSGEVKCFLHNDYIVHSAVGLHMSISIQVAAQVAEWVTARIPGWVTGRFLNGMLHKF